MIILEAKERKRISKRIKREYFRLDPGESWYTNVNGERITIIAGMSNTQTIYVGRVK